MQRALVDSQAVDILELTSDHRCVSATLRCSVKPCVKTKTKKKQIHRPDFENYKFVARFHANLDGSLSTITNMDADSLTQTIVQAARCSQAEQEITAGSEVDHDELELRELFQKRKTTHGDERTILSKEIWQMLRTMRKRRLDDKLDHLLRHGRGQADLKRLMSGPIKRVRIAAIQDLDGLVRTDQQEIATVFAEF